MASGSRDSMAQYFKKGADVEISSNDEGFRGSWYIGKVVRAPRNPKKGTSKVLVEYETLTEDEEGTQRLREEVEVVQLRPLAPREEQRCFKTSEDVDAYYSDGWWEGVITEVVEEDNYLVFFRGTREQIAFKGSELRLHREWVYGKWVPPLETSLDDEPKNEELPASPIVETKKETIEHDFSPGVQVEVCSNEEGFEGAWFIATILKKLDKGKYEIEYKHLKNDDDTGFLREEIDSLFIRPGPPEVGLVDGYDVLEQVDAWCNEGWWVGVISKVLKNDKYSVYFKTSDEELKLDHSDLRVHQDWINGKWVIPPKVQTL